MHIIIVTDSFALSGGSRQALYQVQALDAMKIQVTMVVPKNSQLSHMIPLHIQCVTYEGNAFSMATAIKHCISKGETIIHSYHNTALKVLSFWGMLWKMEYPRLRCVAHRGVSVHPRNPLPYWTTGIDCFLPNSYAVAKQLKHFLPFSDIIRVIYNGIPKERITPSQYSLRIPSLLKLPKERYIFVSIVNDSERKGGKELLQAFEQLSGEPHLILIGSSEDFVERVITDIQTKNRIHVIHTHDVADYLVHANCFVFPSLSFDSLPNVILEAMGVGLPIIATKVGGTPELIIDNGVLVPPKDIKALVKAMQYAIDNPSALRELGKKSREQFHQFTIEERTQRLLLLYSELLESPMR